MVGRAEFTNAQEPQKSPNPRGPKAYSNMMHPSNLYGSWKVTSFSGIANPQLWRNI